MRVLVRGWMKIAIAVVIVVAAEGPSAPRRGWIWYILQTMLMLGSMMRRKDAYGARHSHWDDYRGGVFAFERRRGRVFGLGFEVLGRNRETSDSWMRVATRGWSSW